jgi:hypothetical protein
MRQAFGLILLAGAAALSQPVMAQGQPMPPSVLQSQDRLTDSQEVQAAASRRRSQEREQEWDRKMRSSTKSICQGC